METAMNNVFAHYKVVNDVGEYIIEQVYRSNMSSVFKDIKNFVGFKDNVNYCSKMNIAIFFTKKIVPGSNRIWRRFFWKNVYLQNLSEKHLQIRTARHIMSVIINKFSPNNNDLEEMYYDTDIFKRYAEIITPYHLGLKWYEIDEIDDFTDFPSFAELGEYKKRLEFFKGERTQKYNHPIICPVHFQGMIPHSEWRNTYPTLTGDVRYDCHVKDEIKENFLVYALKIGPPRVRGVNYFKKLCRWNGITMGNKTKVQMIQALMQLKDGENMNDKYGVYEDDVELTDKSVAKSFARNMMANENNIEQKRSYDGTFIYNTFNLV
tara:strand:+ start:655 stop:1617 length:963 start_codon:yes stop_codon:yes gene_type:complete